MSRNRLNGKHRRGRARKVKALQPAAKIIRWFGGPRAIAKICATSVTAPYRWQNPIELGGTGGLIPPRYHLKILKAADKYNIPFAPENFYKRRWRR